MFLHQNLNAAYQDVAGTRCRDDPASDQREARCHGPGSLQVAQALPVAERELVLLNFADFHPFDAAVWKAGSVKVASDIPVGAGWVFQPSGIASERDQQRSLPEGLDQSKDVLKSVAIWLRVVNATDRFGWRIPKAACYPYQESNMTFLGHRANTASCGLPTTGRMSSRPCM